LKRLIFLFIALIKRNSMFLEIIYANNRKIAVVPSGSIPLTDTDELLDLMAEAAMSGAHSIIVNEDQLPPAFFELKTGVAGEMLQKFSNYRMHLAIVGDFSKFNSKSLKDFIRESNRTGRIIFVKSIDAARKQFSK
jgi:Domain of unknown function (DUF4180)